MTDFTVYINGKKHHRYHGFTAKGICHLGESIIQDKPQNSVFIADDDNNIYFEYEPIKKSERNGVK